MARNMPAGVEVAPLGRRLLGWLIDVSVPAVLSGGMYLLGGSLQGSQLMVATIVLGLLNLAWGLLLWWGYASRGAGVGFRAVGLQLVGLNDGKPIGWWRYFVRQLVFTAVMATVVGGIALLIFLVIQERRQGWHDLAARSVAIKQRAATTGRPTRTTHQQRPKAPSTTVALPPHLIAAAFDDSSRSGTSTQPSGAEQVWQASTYGGQQSMRPPANPDSGWRPPSGPGAVAGPGSGGAPAPAQPQWSQPSTSQGSASQPSANQPSANQAYGQPSASQPYGQPSASQPSASQPSANQPYPQPSASQPSANQAPWSQPSAAPAPSNQAPMGRASAGQPASGPTQAPPVPAQWSPPATSNASAETAIRSRSDMTDDDEYGGTRMVNGPQRATSRPMTEGWFLRFDDGRMVSVDKLILVGRNPATSDGGDATLVTIGEDGHAVSKTHLAVGVDQRGVHVTDRGSTNGTALVNARGELEPCLPGIQARCREGQVVSFGDHSFTVLRRPVEG